MSRQYQSFPDARGDSQTLEKLKALRLPSLAGKTFLDVGCNEGFFCGYARFDGAIRAVGIDRSADIVSRARARFPDCEFLAQSWDRLPDGPFDVILLASALHYADDQPALVHALIERLAPEGTLVLELGVVAGGKAEWVRVKRGSDERLFPTMGMLNDMLAPYAYKRMARSVSQSGDPVPRFVVHVQRRKPFAYLLMQPPAYGKSTIARTLFRKAGVDVISGDDTIQRIATGSIPVSPALARAVEHDFSHLEIDRVLAHVVEAGLGEDLVRALLARAGRDDFALDAYLPPALHADVERIARAEGYVPVVLRWEPAGPRPKPKALAEASTEAFFASLARPKAASGASREPLHSPSSGTSSDTATLAIGYVDEIRFARADVVRLRGWAFDHRGSAPNVVVVTLAGEHHESSSFTRTRRPDVVKEHGVTDPLVGFEIDVPVASAPPLDELVARLEVRVRAEGRAASKPLRISPRILGAR